MGVYLPLVVTVTVASVIAAGMLIVDSLLGPNYSDSEKEQPYECGVYRGEQDDSRMNVRAPFFSTALLFLVFGVEIAFLLLWAVSFREMGWAGFVEMMVFAGLLVLGLAYAWRKGALEWE